MEDIAGGTAGRDALGFRAHQSLSCGEVCLPKAVGLRDRVIPTHQMDIPHRAVIELAGKIGHVLQDVERRLPIKNCRVETLALRVAPARLTIDKGDETFTRTAGIDEGSLDIDVVCAAVGKGDVAEGRRVGHVFDRRWVRCRSVK